MNIEIRTLREDEFEKWWRADARGFGSHFDEADVSIVKPTREIDRTLVAVENDQIVGATTAHTLHILIPGGKLPVAVVDDVTVQPTHRRRGIMTTLMELQLKDFHERGDPLAALGASESGIYSRFGYGIATYREEWEIQRPYTAFAYSPEVRGSLRFIETDEARKILPDLDIRSNSRRPGFITSKPAFYDMWLADPERERRGGGALFYVVYEEDGRIDGFVAYRIKDDTVMVWWLLAATDAAHAALWRYCFDIDLMSSTQAIAQPVDDPLIWMLANTRRLKRSVRDSVWLRIVDVQAALSERSYAHAGSLVLEIQDELCPWNTGRIELEASPEGAHCRATDKTPDLILGPSELAGVYLGASTFQALAWAGRVEEGEPGGVQKADTLFATNIQPYMSGF